MRIAVNTQLLIKDKLEGIGWFEYETLKRITTRHPEHEFYFIFDRPWHDDFIFSDNVHPLKSLLPSRHPFLWYVHFHHVLPALLKKHKIDLFVSPDGWNVPAAFKSLIVLHDLNFLHFPRNLPLLYRKYYERFFPEYAKNAKHIVTVSNYSKQDICRSFSIPESQVDVVYNGASEEFVPLTPDEVTTVRQKYSDGEPYFIFVGALNPRKNIHKLLLAFDAFCRKHNSNTRLIIAGVPMFSSSFSQSNIDGLAHHDRIRFVGRLDRAELARLTGGASALILPSTFEGFGIPIVEALYCDVPVITSNVTAMPEVAGQAALLIDPHSVESITHAMIRILDDTTLRKDLIEAGRLQRQKYSWDKAADMLWHSIEKCLTLPS